MPNPHPNYRPKTIQEIGLKKYLNSSKEKHDGRGYDDIVDLFKNDINNSNIAKLFKVNWRTVKGWKEIWIKESES